MQITDVKCLMLIDPERDVTATSSAQDSLVVKITTDSGLYGIGETDLNPVVARACIEAPSAHSMALGLKDMLIGEDPRSVERLWEKLYVGSAMTGRRGAGINAMGAIDIALHDLRGKATGKPIWQCVSSEGTEPRSTITPYASLQPDVDQVDEYEESLIAYSQAAIGQGFKAIKASITLTGPFAHRGMSASWQRATQMLAALRSAIGPEVVLMVDVQYAFTDVDECLRVLADWTVFDLYFVETPLWPDDVSGYRRLVHEQGIPIAMGEWLTTRHEFRPFIEARALDVLQPDIGRVGGLTEAWRVADMARDRGIRVVPHLWKTGISIAAALHFAAVTSHCPYIEFLPAAMSDSAIRRELLLEDFELIDGELLVPNRPGLGVEIDPEAVERYTMYRPVPDLG